MIRRTGIVLAAAAVTALLGPTNASGAWKRPDPISIPPGLSTVRLASAVEASRLSASPGWRDFTHRHPGWRAVWDAVTASPHRAFGPPIPLPAFVSNPQGVDRAVRAFVAGHPGTFGAPTLETVSVREVRGIWYVRYRQLVGGLPVLFASWEFRVGRQGRLFVFGAHVQNVPPTVAAAADRIGAAGARAAAIRDLPFAEARDRTVDHGLAILPWGESHRLVHAVTVETFEPRGGWLALVDAVSGETLVREDRVLHAISGVSTGAVHPLLPSDPPAAKPLRDLRVFFGSETRVTDSTGVFVFADATGIDTVRAGLAGPYVYVKNMAGPLPAFTAAATAPAAVAVTWDDSNSDLASRDVYYHVNRARAHISTFDPLFTGLDYPIAAGVNRQGGSCNAFYVNNSITFYDQGDGCPNMAYLPDVVYHEYGHALTEALYIQNGEPFGLRNVACHEAMADVFAAFLDDDPVVGQDFFGPGTELRTIDNTRHWPEDDDNSSHEASLILSGAFWDLRQSIGLEHARTLSHYCKYGLPDYRPNNGVAMNDFFLETVIADDDDSDLTNGTPHIDQIVAAFNAHGIGTGFWLGIGHDNIADHPGPGPFAIRAAFTYSGPFGDLDVSRCRMHYRVNAGPWTSCGLFPTENWDELMGVIDVPPEAVVRYYFESHDVYGGVNVLPLGAPLDDSFEFVVGSTVTLLTQNMETNPGWTAGAPGDNAATGIWIRLNPNSTYFNGGYLQPEDDHTPFSATRCWVTGDAPPTEPPGLNDVDGGKTTLTTMMFDATGGYGPMVEYYRWFTNAYVDGAGLDPWRVQISNDGGLNWTDVEYTFQDAREWRRIVFMIQEFVQPTANMKLRFIATDEGPGTLIEGAVDDFRLLAFANPLSVPDVASGSLAFSAPAPNPLRAGNPARIEFALPREGPMRLAVVDVQGREVALLVDGPRPGGLQTIEWDGRGSGGRRLSPGMYFLNLVAADSRRSRRIMLLE